jgi:hypothetical protein
MLERLAMQELELQMVRLETQAVPELLVMLAQQEQLELELQMVRLEIQEAQEQQEILAQQVVLELERPPEQPAHQILEHQETLVILVLRQIQYQ